MSILVTLGLKKAAPTAVQVAKGVAISMAKLFGVVAVVGGGATAGKHIVNNVMGKDEASLFRTRLEIEEDFQETAPRRASAKAAAAQQRA